MNILAPSILSLDFRHMEEDLITAYEAGAGYIHVAVGIIRISGLHFPSGGLYDDIFQNWI